MVLKVNSNNERIKKKIAIYGGAFDPPHKGHLHAINIALNSKLFDEIWIMPSGVRSDKGYKVEDKYRIMMLEDLIKNQIQSKAVKLKLFEIENRILGSVELFDYLTTNFSEMKFYLLCGDELIVDLTKWKNPERVKEIDFVFINRSQTISHSNNIERDLKEKGYKALFLNNKEVIQISSSQIRQDNQRNGVCDSTKKIIDKFNLYN